MRLDSIKRDGDFANLVIEYEGQKRKARIKLGNRDDLCLRMAYTMRRFQNRPFNITTDEAVICRSIIDEIEQCA